MFSQIGGDSITASMLSKQLRARFGVVIDSVDVFRFPLGHLSELIERADSHIFGTGCKPPPINWQVEQQLPPALVAEIQAAAGHPALDPTAPRHVFLIGATGFLGPVLVAEILKQFPVPVQLFCLIRAAHPDAARQRLVRELEAAQLWATVQADFARVTCLNGDLATETLSLPASVYADTLAQCRGGYVFHNAARVNMMMPYEGLKDPNVTGLLHVLRFAVQARAALHFVSTVAAVGGYDTSEVSRTLDPREIESKDGYGQTKVVNESHLRAALALDPSLDIRIYRPCTISGHRGNGYTNKTDFFASLMKVIVQLQVAPLQEAHTKDLHWIPVDFVARGIVALSQIEAGGGLPVFHFSGDGPNFGVALETLRASLLPTLQDIPASRWAAVLGEARARGAVSDTEYDLLLKVVWGDRAGTYAKGVDTARTREILATQCGLPYAEPVSPADIARSIAYLQAQNFFKLPQ